MSRPWLLGRIMRVAGFSCHHSRTMTEPRANVREILQSHSRKLLHDFREGAKTSNVAYDPGLSREKAVRDFLNDRLPGRYAVGDGLVIDLDGGQSKQCDVVVYDR